MSFGVTTSETVTDVILGDAFYPDLALAEFLATYRLPAEYAASLMVDHLRLAQVWAAKQLATFRAQHEGQPLSSLPWHGIPGGAELMYKRAVFCRAKGILLQQFFSIERRDSAKIDVKDGPDHAEGFLAAARMAIADLLGTPFINTGLL